MVLPNFSDSRLIVGIFVGLQIEKILKDTNFYYHFSTLEKDARSMLGNIKTEDWFQFNKRLLQKWKSSVWVPV